MGCLLSCFKKAASSGATSNGAKETEMASNKSGGKSLSVSRSMTAPTIEVKNGTELSGMGLALVGTTVEQDAAYVSFLSKSLCYYQTCARSIVVAHSLCLFGAGVDCIFYYAVGMSH